MGGGFSIFSSKQMLKLVRGKVILHIAKVGGYFYEFLKHSGWNLCQLYWTWDFFSEIWNPFLLFSERSQRTFDIYYENLSLIWIYRSFCMLSELNYWWSYWRQKFRLVWGAPGITLQFTYIKWVICRLWHSLE